MPFYDSSLLDEYFYSQELSFIYESIVCRMTGEKSKYRMFNELDEKKWIGPWLYALDLMSKGERVRHTSWSEERFIRRDEKKRVVNEKNELATITEKEIRSNDWTDF